MEHEHGHWFVIGILLSGVLLGIGAFIKAMINTLPQTEANPFSVILVALILCGGAVWLWWRDRD